MTTTLDHVADETLVAFADEMLDDHSDLGELAAAAFGCDPDAAWRAAATRIADLFNGTTSRSRGRNKTRRERAELLLYRLLSNPHTSPDAMIAAVDVAKSSDLEWRETRPLMDNPAATNDVLVHVTATYGPIAVSWGGGLAHLNASHDLIRHVAGDYISDTAADQICHRPDLDDELLNWVAQRISSDSTTTFAARDDLSEDSYRHLAARGVDKAGKNNGGSYGGVRRYLAENPAVPTSLLDELACDDHEQVRRGVAANPSTSDVTLRVLLDDSHDRVVAAAFRQLRARGTITI